MPNKLPNDFIPLLNTMKNGVMHRLDVSSVGCAQYWKMLVWMGLRKICHRVQWRDCMMAREGIIVPQACQRHNFISRRRLHHRHRPPLLLLVRHQPRHHLRLDNNLHQPPHLVQHQTHRWKIQAQLLLLEVVDLDQQQNGGRIYAACYHRFCIGNA